jgi:hypothetical protein
MLGSRIGSGSLTTVVRELTRYKLGLVGVWEVRWDKGGRVRAGDYIFFYRQGNHHQQLGTRFLVHHRIVSAVKNVEFVSDRMSCVGSERMLELFCCFECESTK